RLRSAAAAGPGARGCRAAVAAPARWACARGGGPWRRACNASWRVGRRHPRGQLRVVAHHGRRGAASSQSWRDDIRRPTQQLEEFRWKTWTSARRRSASARVGTARRRCRGPGAPWARPPPRRHPPRQPGGTRRTAPGGHARGRQPLRELPGGDGTEPEAAAEPRACSATTAACSSQEREAAQPRGAGRGRHPRGAPRPPRPCRALLGGAL
ncbi:Protein of unknown function, partial [Gryllus bimaculatus]